MGAVEYNNKNGSVHFNGKRVRFNVENSLECNDKVVSNNGATGPVFTCKTAKNMPTEIPSDLQEKFEQLSIQIDMATKRFWTEAEYLNNRIGNVEDTSKKITNALNQVNEAKTSRLNELFAKVNQIDYSLSQDLFDLIQKVEELSHAKIDKPSVSQELLDAEQYIDDYNEIKKDFANRRWARKRRMEDKLKRIQNRSKIKKNEEAKGYKKKIFIILGIIGTIAMTICIL